MCRWMASADIPTLLSIGYFSSQEREIFRGFSMRLLKCEQILLKVFLFVRPHYRRSFHDAEGDGNDRDASVAPKFNKRSLHEKKHEQL